MPTYSNDPFAGLDEDDVIIHEDADELYKAAGKIFDKTAENAELDVDPADAVLVGEPGDGADIDMDTFEPVEENERNLKP